jgi:hypothetical protein
MHHDRPHEGGKRHPGEHQQQADHSISPNVQQG